MKLPRLELDGLELEPRLAMLIPKHIAERQYVVPVFASEEEVTVATSDPSRIELVDWLRRELRRTVVLVVASPPEIESAIRRLYAPQIQVASRRRAHRSRSRSKRCEKPCRSSIG